MASDARRIQGTFKPGRFDLLGWTWNFLTNVKVALFLIGLVTAAASLGVVLPQVPAPMRANAAARSVWMEHRRDDFGALTGLMDRLDLFDIFYSYWFNGLWVLIIVAVAVSTVSRFRPTARSIHRPQREVPDRYFEIAHHRADYTHPGGAGAVAAALRKRRYAVEQTSGRDGATYLFAQRYSWSAYGTFISHLALLIFMIGGLLTRFVGFDQTLVLAEDTPAAPVFGTPGPGQLFVKMLDAYRGKDAAGNVIDFHSDIQVTRGDQTVTCTTTVNDPCKAFGYKVHQAAFFDDVARLRIVAPDGQLLFADNLDFEGKQTFVPHFRVTSPSGEVVFDEPVPQMGLDPGATASRGDDLAVARISYPLAKGATEGRALTLSWRISNGQLSVVAGGDGLPVREFRQGDEASADGYRIRYDGAQAIPAKEIDDLPGADGPVVFQMPTGEDGQPYLFVTGFGDGAAVLLPGQGVLAPNGYGYTFEHRVEASGVSVKRDPGSLFIWLAVGMAIVGLSITFYVPRRRLWVKVTPARTYFAGIAEKTTRLGRELRVMGAELGSKDAIRPEDLPER